jgi:hypothetical protein
MRPAPNVAASSFPPARRFIARLGAVNGPTAPEGQARSENSPSSRRVYSIHSPRSSRRCPLFRSTLTVFGSSAIQSSAGSAAFLPHGRNLWKTSKLPKLPMNVRLFTIHPGRRGSRRQLSVGQRHRLGICRPGVSGIRRCSTRIAVSPPRQRFARPRPVTTAACAHSSQSPSCRCHLPMVPCWSVPPRTSRTCGTQGPCIGHGSASRIRFRSASNLSSTAISARSLSISASRASISASNTSMSAHVGLW